MECVTATDTNASDTKNKNIGIAINKDNVYTGIIGENYSTNLMKTYIGIKNKTSNKVCYLYMYIYIVIIIKICMVWMELNA